MNSDKFTPPLCFVCLALFFYPQTGHGQEFPDREGKNQLVVTSESTPVYTIERGNRVTVATAYQDTSIQFFLKVGDAYMIPFKSKRAYIAAADIKVVSRERVPGWSDEKNRLLEEAEEHIVLGGQRKGVGDFKEAAAHAAIVVKRLNATYGKDDPLSLLYLGNLGLAYLQAGQLEQALSCLVESVKGLRQKRVKPEFTATMLGNLANAQAALGDDVGAFKNFDEAIAIAEKHLPETRQALAILLNNAARVHSDIGSYEKAQSLTLKALEMEKELNGTESLGYATLVANVAAVSQAQGNLADARTQTEEALALQIKILGAEHPRVALTRANLASLFYALGDVNRAIAVNKLALSTFKEKLTVKHPQTIAAIQRMGNFYNKAGEHTHAKQYYQFALSLNRSVYGPDHPKTIASASSVAFSKTVDGNHEEAARECEELLERFVRMHGDDHPLAEELNVVLSNIYFDSRQFEKASVICAKRVEANSKVHGPEHPTVADSQNFLALALAKSDDMKKGLESAIDARRIYAKWSITTLPHLSENEQLKFLARDNDSLNNAMSIALQVKGQSSKDQIATWVLNSKGRIVEAMSIQNRMLRGVNDPKSQSLVRELSLIRRKIAELNVQIGTAIVERNNSPQLARLTERERAITRELDREYMKTESSWKPVTVADVQARVPEGGVLLEITRVEPLDFDPEKKASVVHAPRYYAIIVQPGKPTEIVDLGLASEIEAAIDRVRKSLDRSAALLAQEADVAAERLIKPPLRALSDRLYKPLRQHLADKQQLIISLDGPLWLMPWENLLIDDETYAVEKHIFRYVVSGRYLVHRNPIFKEVSSPLIFADPDYDFLPPRADLLARAKRVNPVLAFLESPRLERLRGSRLEGMVTGRLVEKHYGSKPQVHVDKDASEAEIKKAKNPQLLYLSTHGYFSVPQESRKTPSKFGIVTSSEDYVSNKGNPLLRCGVCLAGCNQIGVLRELGVDIEDGILTGKEVMQLDLRGTELVVLSACQTAVGDVRYGEGVAGLRQAFHMSGAKSVIGTSWSVFDRESSLLMLMFFRKLGATRDKALALQRAQVELIALLRATKKAAHPLYWGAFSISYR